MAGKITPPDPTSKSDGGFWARPSEAFTSVGGNTDFSSAPFTDSFGREHVFFRALIANADGTIDVTPINAGTPVTMTVKAGIALPVVAEAVASITGPTSVAVLF